MLRPCVAYWEHPDQVLWVDIGHRRLQGTDTMWVDGDRYGVCNDSANMDSMYEGRQWCAWQLTPDGEIEIDQPTPPEDALVWRGFMLSDDDARSVGLI